MSDNSHDQDADTNVGAATEDPSTPPEPCCDGFDPDSKQFDCALCQKTTCKACRKRINGQAVCTTCATEVLEELENQKVTSKGVVMGGVGALVAAIVAGAIWAVISISSGYEIGYVAIGVGWLAGMGASLGSGRKTGQALQVVSAIGALMGLVLAKYFMVAHQAIEYFAQEAEMELSYFSPEIMNFFMQIFTDTLSPWDLLWAALAIGAAWKACAPTEVSVR